MQVQEVWRWQPCHLHSYSMDTWTNKITISPNVCGEFKTDDNVIKNSNEKKVNNYFNLSTWNTYIHELDTKQKK